MNKKRYICDKYMDFVDNVNLYEIILLAIGVIVAIVAYLLNVKELYVISSIFILVANLNCCIVNMNDYFIYFSFICGLFLFLLGKPIINIFKLDSIATFAYRPFSTIMVAIIVSMLCLYMGSKIYYIRLINRSKVSYKKIYFDVKLVRKISLSLIILSFIPIIWSSIEKISFVIKHSYVEYYSTFKTNMPALFIILQQFFVPCVFLYLATFPKKKNAIFIIGMYITSNIASFVVGMRSPLMLSIVLAIVYCLIRYYWINDNSKLKINIKTVIVIVIVVPLIMLVLMSYNYIRQDKEVPKDKLINPVVSFIDQQGQSFIVLCQGYTNINKIKKNNFPGYTFGPIYDSIKYNTFSRIIFGTKDISGQSENAIKYGHDMKAHLSYALYNNKYYQGHGAGSSYIFELFYDFGYLGIAVFSIYLGYIMLKFKEFVLQKDEIRSTAMLFIIANLVYLPRSNTSLVFGFLFNIYNIITYIIVYMLYFCVKRLNSGKK